MAGNVSPIPPGFHTITPHLVMKGAGAAIDFYKKAFGAEEVFRMPGPDGQSVMHAEIKIGDSIVMLADEWPGMETQAPCSLKGTTVVLGLYVRDADAAFNQAVAAGGKPLMPPTDMFWGDRYAKVQDPFGHSWSIATHKEDVPPEEMAQRAAAAFGGEPCTPPGNG